MLCEKCHENEAAVHFTEVINGKKREMHLCESCASELQPEGFSFMPQINFHNFLGGLMGHNVGPGSFTKTATKDLSCEVCGLSEKEFARRGLLGCGECYESFKHTLDSLVKRIHGTNEHNGKLPERSSDRVKLVKEIESLRNQLRQAVEAEEFERAAQLRDSIRDVEKRLEQEG
ncbi:MAG: hypothetical protein FH756_21170 [Firmicutes bacterium]|nr:hypothetical protein [Bacillota bacterium]